MTSRVSAAHLMLADCRPTPLDLPFLAGEKSAGATGDIDIALELVTQHRKLHCRHYDGCLTHAAGQGWHGWSCRGCPLKSEEP